MEKLKPIFYKAVDKRSRAKMTEFLTNHERYFTMSSWNKCSSYANNVKIYNLKLPSDIADKAYSVLGVDGLMSYAEDLIDEFSRKYAYDVGFNGHQYGYLVLYDACWVDGKLETYMHSVDDDAPYCYDDMDMYELKKRTELVQAFDKLCDDIRLAFVELLSEHDVVIETELVSVEKNKA